MTAIEQYQDQVVHFRRWGYTKLVAQYRDDVAEEREHLSAITERLEYYDVKPECGHEMSEWPRHDYEGILESNYDLEMTAMNVERANVVVARIAGDEVTAAIFALILAGSEASVSKIEAEKKQIEQIGLDNYLANKV